MLNEAEEIRKQAITRYQHGESSGAICLSLGQSRSWLYKWLSRSGSGKEDWYRDQLRRPLSNPRWTSAEMEEIVKSVRLELYNRGDFCGVQAIHWHMEDLGLRPLPSLRTIGRILDRNQLTHRRTGRYEPKGVYYPKVTAESPNDLHQSDYVGPCYLKGGIRFYSLHSVDLATGRCAVEPVTGGKGTSGRAFWAIWHRLGMPRYQQIDNEMTFYGSPTHPRGMGKLIRLCLHHGIEPIFIPVKEPWRNGVVEKFNHHWRQKFLEAEEMDSTQQLQHGSLNFETNHNSRYRYSKLGGKTPLQSLASSQAALRFPPTLEPPQEPLSKPSQGRYHVVRLIRSDRKLDIFGESFRVPVEAVYEYVWATIDVKKQCLSLYVGDELLKQQDYRVR